MTLVHFRNVDGAREYDQVILREGGWAECRKRSDGDLIRVTYPSDIIQRIVGDVKYGSEITNE